MSSEPFGDFHPIRIEVEDNGIVTLLQGSLPLTLPAGEYKERILPNPDAPIPSWLSDWLSSTGLDGMAGAGVLAGSLWRLSHFLLPQLTPTDERLQLFARYLIFSTLASEHEEMVSMRSGNSRMVEMNADLISDIMKFKYEATRDLPEVPPTTIPLFSALFSLRDQSRVVIPDFGATATPLVAAMRTSVLANSRLGLKVMTEMPETFKYFKRYAGSEVMLELGAILLGLTLPPSVRQDLLVQRVIGVAATIVGIVADLRNLGRGRVETNFVTFVQKGRGVELKEAFEETLKELEQDVKEFKILCSTLRGLFKKNLRLSKYLKTLETFIDGSAFGF